MSSQTTDLSAHEATDGLVLLVRAEYPADLSLAEIAETWGRGLGLTTAQVEAIAALERRR
jgi:hypothetical protein